MISTAKHVAVSAEDAAQALLRVAPLVMQTVRTEMRSRRALQLSVPQFRTLGFLHRHPASSLSEAAEHIGVSLPAMSRLVDGLVVRDLLQRQGDVQDRRRITLALTPSGATLLETARSGMQQALTARLSVLDPAGRGMIVGALALLQPLFMEHAAPVEHTKKSASTFSAVTREAPGAHA